MILLLSTLVSVKTNNKTQDNINKKNYKDKQLA